MGRLRIICSLVFALLSESFLWGTPLIIEDGDWGDVETSEIHQVLKSTLSVFHPFPPPCKSIQLWYLQLLMIQKFYTNSGMVMLITSN